MRIVVLDFESFFSTKDGYTLTKIGPISYIRDSRFSAQLMSYIVTDASTMTYDRVRVAEHDNIPAVLAALKLDAPDVVTVAHNGNGFDFLILSEIYHVVPRIAIDTMCMERWTGVSRIQNESLKSMVKFFQCGEKVEGTVISDGRKWPEDFTPDERTAFIQYCRNDTEQCFLSFKAMLPFVTADALLFSSITAKMACNPVLRLDDDMLTAYLNELSDKVTKARNDINKMFVFKSDEDFLKAIRSSASFVKMLELLGRKPPMKYSVAKSETKRKKLEAEGKTNLSEEDYAVYTPALAKSDLDFVAMASDADERVALLVRTRLENNSSIQRSRAETFHALAKSGRPMPVMLNAFKAHTSRYTAGNSEGSSDKLNLQNLSKRDPSQLTLRKAVQAPEGMALVACDSSQIEARILAYVANETELVDAFRRGADPYADLAEKIFQIPSEKIHKGAKSGDKKLKAYRNVGKTGILSCLAGDTEVLTNNGWKPIVMVSKDDKLWDGVQWVTHQGLICNGEKNTIDVDGVRMTPDHMILSGSSWKQARRCAQTRSYLSQALCTGGESLEIWRSMIGDGGNTCANAPSVELCDGLASTLYGESRLMPASIAPLETLVTSSLSGHVTRITSRVQRLVSSLSFVLQGYEYMVRNVLKEWFWCSVPVEQNRTGYCSATSTMGGLHGVIPVLRRRHRKAMLSYIPLTRTFAQNLRTGDVCSIELPLLSSVVTTPTVDNIKTTGGVESNASLLTVERFLPILYHWTAGIIRTSTLTVSTIMATTKLVISGLLQSLRITTIGGVSVNCKPRLKNSEPVYDLLNAGPNHRFTIRTKHGALVVHNCGYGVSWRKYADTLLRQGVRLSSDIDQHYEMAHHAHNVYRASNPNIVAFWDTCQTVIKALYLGYSGEFGGPNDNIFQYSVAPICGRDDVPTIIGPNKYTLRYFKLSCEVSEKNNREEYYYTRVKGKSELKTKIYGGALAENLCQYLAFALLQWQACRMTEQGIRLIANIHDSFLAICPEDEAEHTKSVMESCMSSVPDWLGDFPVACEAEIGKDYCIA